MATTCKYTKLAWPEYQDYMDDPDFRAESEYDCENNRYVIPNYIIERVDKKNGIILKCSQEVWQSWSIAPRQ